MAKKLTDYDKKTIEAGNEAIKNLNVAIEEMDNKIENSSGKQKGDACSHHYKLETVKGDLLRVLSDIEYH